MIFQTLLPPVVLIVLTGITIGVSVWVFLKHRHNTRKWVNIVLRTLIVLMTILLLARPGVIGTENKETYTNQYDIYFVVDVTASMVAEDWGTDGETRLNAVKNDISNMVSDYPDARYALIKSSAQSSIVTPLTKDSTAFMSGVEYLEPEITRYSQGSNSKEFLETLNESLKLNATTNPDRISMVFVFGDGETTNSIVNTQVEENISQYVSGGGVLGYGTLEGGKMKIQQGYFISNDKGYIQDPTTGKDAISKIDETGLQEIADILGVPYVHRTPDQVYTPPTMETQYQANDMKNIRVVQDLSWIIALVLIGLYLTQITFLIRKYRNEKLLLPEGER